MNKIKIKNNGITLIALIITIILILILACVTVTVSINGGLFKYAGGAKDSVEIANEKDIIQEAFIWAKGNSKRGKVTKENFQKELNSITDKNKAKVYDIDENFLIKFESNRAYTVDNNGKILGIEEGFKTPNKLFLGQLSDSSYGTAEKPYEINCIEDLVDLSFTVNGIEVLEDGSIDWVKNGNFLEGKNIIVNRNLSFTSELSYEDASRTDYGDINGNEKIEDLLTELTTGTGWISIGDARKMRGVFCANFNGNGKKISNLYIHNTESLSMVGLFGSVGRQGKNSSVTNIAVSGNIYCNSSYAGGIVSQFLATDNVEMENCSFSGKIENINNDSYVGGLIGNIISNKVNITNSYNESTVIGGSRTGGIVGSGGESYTNCYNIGTIKGNGYTGGIVGYCGAIQIESCYNTGTINSLKNGSGGICGVMYTGSYGKIYRCYNTGAITAADGTVGGILGHMYSSNNMIIEQCYNTGEITGTTHTAGIVGCIFGYYSRILNCYNTGNVKGTNIAGIVSGEGQMITAIIFSCYNTGTLNATTKFGVVRNYANATKTYNSYYLSTCGATDIIATALVESDLKASASTLDKKYTINEEDNIVTISETETQSVWVEDTNNINEGYPILSWQVPVEN